MKETLKNELRVKLAKAILNVIMPQEEAIEGLDIHLSQNIENYMAEAALQVLLAAKELNDEK